MTSVTPRPRDGDLDAVDAALGSLGHACRLRRAGSRVDLEGPQVLWLVAAGALDLFAVDAARAGPLALPRPAGGGHAAARPGRRARSTPWSAGRSADCVVRRIRAARAVPSRAGTDDTGSYDAVRQRPTYGASRRPARWSTPSRSGVGRRLAILFAGAAGRSAAGRPAPADDDMLWMQVPPGSVQYGAAYSAEAAGDLLMDPAVWQGMVDQQYRLLSALDRWIEQLERAHEDRTAAGIKAGEAVRAQADQALLASIGTAGAAAARRPGRRRRRDLRGLPAGRRRRPGSRSPSRRARAAPRATGSTRSNGSRSPPASAPAPSGSTGRWWRDNAGPLVGHRGHVGRAGGAAVAARRLRGGATRPRAARRRVGEGERGGVRAARRDVLPPAARTAA